MAIISCGMIQSDFGIKSDGEIVLQAGKTLFNIRLSYKPPEGFDGTNTVEGDFLSLLENAVINDEWEKSDEILEELGDILASLCQPYFEKYACPPECSNTLMSHVNLETKYLQLVTEEGLPKVITRSDHRPLSCFSSRSLPEIDGVPKFGLAEVEVKETFIERYLLKVGAAGREYFCKMDRKDGSNSFSREIQLLHRISSLDCPRGSLCVPKLEGIVGFKEGFPGVLLTFIPHNRRLSDIDDGEVPDGIRRRWADQIRSTIQILHANDIIWGDVKAENVLIDLQDNAWLVDFWWRFYGRVD